MIKTAGKTLLVAVFCLALCGRGSAEDAFPVSIHIDVAKPKGNLKPIWRFFGADEPNYAYMKDGTRLLGELGQLKPGQIYFRAHNLLTSGDGTPDLKWGSTGVYNEDDKGNPVYDWTIMDRIFDSYLKQKVRPYVEIGFMPEKLSTHPEPYRHHWPTNHQLFTGWSYPPKDYGKWAELVKQWVQHSVDKYGKGEVEHWYWETWNEPNIDYLHTPPEEFFKLHDYAVDAVRRALPTARVGGPDTAGGGGHYLQSFLAHCISGTNYATGKQGTPIDFISFHAKGAPHGADGHLQMGIAQQLKAIDDSFRIIASFPQMQSKPIVIGESDPDGCAACLSRKGSYRNTTLYSSYTAASLAREYELAEKYHVNLEGALNWAFEFEDQPFFAEFRKLSTHGIDLPILNLFRMLSKMGGRQLTVASDHAVALENMLQNGVRDKPDVSALASLEGNRLAILLWHYHDDAVSGPDAKVTLSLSHLPPQAQSAHITQFMIDDTHSNSYTAWQKMDAPQPPTPEQYAALEKAGQLAEVSAPTLAAKDDTGTIGLTLPRQAVTLLVLEFPQ